MQTRIFTAVWGPLNIRLLQSACAKSLSWPKNLAALKRTDALWCLYTNPEERDEIAKIVAPLGLKYEFFDLSFAKHPQTRLQDALVSEIQRCVGAGVVSLNGGPDLVFGDGTVETILSIAAENDERCVSLPTVRVNMNDFILHLPVAPMTNQQLVALTMQYMHESWGTCNTDLSQTNCWNGGASWKKQDDNIYLVTMRLPGVVAARYTQKDMDFFKALQEDSMGAWDHQWPETLVEAERQRIVGSSDAAFIAELTVEKSHLPVLRDKLPNQKDRYKKALLHHRMNANTMIVWRS